MTYSIDFIYFISTFLMLFAAPQKALIFVVVDEAIYAIIYNCA